MKLKRNNFDFAVEEAGCLLTIRNGWPKGPQEMARNDSSFSSRNEFEIRKWKVGGFRKARRFNSLENRWKTRTKAAVVIEGFITKRGAQKSWNATA